MVKIEQVLGEKQLAATTTRQPLCRVRATVRLIRRLLVELFAAHVARERLHAGVQQGVPLEAGGMGEGLGALLADVRAQAGLAVVVQMAGHTTGRQRLVAQRTDHRPLVLFFGRVVGLAAAALACSRIHSTPITNESFPLLFMHIALMGPQRLSTAKCLPTAVAGPTNDSGVLTTEVGQLLMLF